jgi:hypothetical protein
MIRDELAPSLDHRAELEKRKLAVKHAEWTEKVRVEWAMCAVHGAYAR